MKTKQRSDFLDHFQDKVMELRELVVDFVSTIVTEDEEKAQARENWLREHDAREMDVQKDTLGEYITGEEGYRINLPENIQ